VPFTFGDGCGELRIGYCLWAQSFFIVAAGLFLEARRPEPARGPGRERPAT
jgi:hypothetical protein